MAWSEAGRNAVVAVFLAIAASVALGARQDEVRIHGKVLTESGAPLRGVAVTLSIPGAKPWTTSTDDNGLFEVRGLPPGSYQLRLAKTGFLAPAVFQNLPILKSGDVRDAGVIVMRRAGAIAGRVVDEFGEPVVGVMVSADRFVYAPPGSRSLQPTKIATTNDLGEYRLFGLEPGTYYVSVSGRWAAMALAVVRAEQQVTFVPAEPPRTFAPTYFPSARLASEAQPIRLAIGENRFGADITLMNQPLSRVSGRVTMTTGEAAVDGVVVLDTPNLAEPNMSVRQSARIAADGSFSINSVLPGLYTLLAYSRDYSPPLPVAPAVSSDGNRAGAGVRTPAIVARGYESAKTSLTVAGDVAGIEIQLARSFEIRGRVLVDGVPTMISATPAARVGFEAHEAPFGPVPPPVVVQPSGDFVIVGAPPGRTRLAVLGMSTSHMVSRISLNGADVTDEGFDVSAAVSGVEIAITTRPAVALGVVTTASDQRTPSFVIVFSENSRFWTLRGTRYLQLVTSPSSGEFRVSKLPAGRYFAVALPAVEQSTWADPENLAELRKVATPFTMPEAGTVTVNLVRR